MSTDIWIDDIRVPGWLVLAVSGNSNLGQFVRNIHFIRNSIRPGGQKLGVKKARAVYDAIIKEAN